MESCEFEEKILYADIDLGEVNECRNQLMYSKQKRNDLYELKSKI